MAVRFASWRAAARNTISKLYGSVVFQKTEAGQRMSFFIKTVMSLITLTWQSLRRAVETDKRQVTRLWIKLGAKKECRCSGGFVPTTSVNCSGGSAREPSARKTKVRKVFEVKGLMASQASI